MVSFLEDLLHVDPIAFSIGPFDIRWYALAYLAAFVIGWRYAMRLAAKAPIRPNPTDVDDFLTWAILGTILGGRLGYVLFYNFSVYAEDPLAALRIWDGGMSFHGGMLGVIAAMILFARQRGFRATALADIVCAAVPIGLLLGRIANFVNGELYGRVSDVPWAIVFPSARDGFPRHPSQLYEAGLEGLVLLAILGLMARQPALRLRPGFIAGNFLSLYGAMRFLVEFVREPDQQLGFLWLGATMGQLLSIPMIVAGFGLTLWALLHPASRDEVPATVGADTVTGTGVR